MSQAISGIGNPASPSSPPPMTAPSDLPATESTLTTTGNILVIDDEALVLSAVGRALEREGFAVTTGASLADCRDRLREWRRRPIQCACAVTWGLLCGPS